MLNLLFNLFNREQEKREYTQLEVVALHEAGHYILGKAEEDGGEIFINVTRPRVGGICMGVDDSKEGALAGLAVELEIVGKMTEKDCCYNGDLLAYLDECGGSARNFNRDLNRTRRLVRRNAKKIKALAEEILRPENLHNGYYRY